MIQLPERTTKKPQERPPWSRGLMVSHRLQVTAEQRAMLDEIMAAKGLKSLAETVRYCIHRTHAALAREAKKA